MFEVGIAVVEDAHARELVKGDLATGVVGFALVALGSRQLKYDMGKTAELTGKLSYQ